MVSPTAPVQDDDAEWLRQLAEDIRSATNNEITFRPARAWQRLNRIADALSPTPETGLVEALEAGLEYAIDAANECKDKGRMFEQIMNDVRRIENALASLSNVLPDEV